MALKFESIPTESTANVLTEPFSVPLPEGIELYDNSLREGEQTPGVAFSAQEKLELARALDELGVHWANVGFPAVSNEERRSVEAIARAGLRMKTAALSRLLRDDIVAAVDSGVDMVSLFVGSSDVHLQHKYHLSEAAVAERMVECIELVKSQGRRVSLTLEDGSRTPLSRLIRLFEVAERAGADYLVLADTVGVLTPDVCHTVVRTLSALFTTPIGAHFHDDLGLSLANALAALQGGARLVHVTVNGVGERAGNTSLEELAVVLQVKYGRDLGLRLDQLGALCSLVFKRTGQHQPAHKAICGRWSFTHESGIHVAGMLEHPETYQAFPPSLVGRSHEFVFGKHSGGASVDFLANRSGNKMSANARRAVLSRIKEEATHFVGPIPPETVLEWIKGANESPAAE